MSVIDIQRLIALLVYILVALWSFRVGCRSKWVQIRGGMHTITAVSILWILFIVITSSTSAFVEGDHVLKDLDFSIWAFTFLEISNAAGLMLLIFFAKSLSDTQDRAIARLKKQGVQLD